MKILKNSTYLELTNAQEQTKAQLSELQTRYDFIVKENKRLHLKNELLKIENNSLTVKAEKYNIYLQKSKNRKAKAAIRKMSAEKLATKFLGAEILYRDGMPGIICGYSGSLLVLGFENKFLQGWVVPDESDVILNQYPFYVYLNKISASKQLTK